MDIHYVEEELPIKCEDEIDTTPVGNSTEEWNY